MLGILVIGIRLIESNPHWSTVLVIFFSSLIISLCSLFITRRILSLAMAFKSAREVPLQCDDPEKLQRFFKWVHDKSRALLLEIDDSQVALSRRLICLQQRFALSALKRRFTVLHMTDNFLSAVVSCVAIYYIYLGATEVVGLLSSAATILRLRKEVLSLTILAMGNCLGDLFTDSTMSKNGRIWAGVTAVFVSPIQNTLLNVGCVILGNPFERQLSHI